MQSQELADLIFRLYELINNKKPEDAKYIDQKIQTLVKLCDESRASPFVVKILLENEIKKLEKIN